MKKIYYICAVGCLLAVWSSPLLADQGDIGIGLKLGSLGGGIEATLGVSERLNLRLSGNYLQFSASETVGDVDYDLDLDFSNAALFIDFHPFAGIFRITGGALLNGNEMELSGRSASSVHVGDHSYTADQVGTITGTLEFDSFSPYFGIGWSSVHPQEKGWGIALDLGVLFQGSPTLSSLQASGTAAGSSQFESDLEKEKLKIQDDLDSYKYYPAVSVMATYKF